MASLRDFVRQLKADCSTVESTVLHQHLATIEECKAHRPGGAKNAEKGARGWLLNYKWLHRLHAINELRERPTAAGTEGLQGEVLDALAARPERVKLAAGTTGPDGPIDALVVYPKAFGPLIWCHKQSLKLGFFGAHAMGAGQSMEPGDRDVILLAIERISRLHRQLVWAATHEGPGLPFDRAKDPDPDPPAWTDTVNAIDIHRVVQAFQRVHGSRLIALDKLIPSSTDTPPAPTMWATFAVGSAEALGIRVHDLVEAISLPEVVAQLRASSHLQKTAMDAAKARAKRERGQ